jgi:muramoyltetrapeptide carboxypeptidase
MIGTRILAIAPSHAYDPAKLDAGLAIARDAGFDVTALPDTLRPHRYFASRDDHRLAQLVSALADPWWDAVWAIRGGSGVTRLLPRIPWETLPPRPFIGFSDLTPLLDALRVRVGSPVVHGPVLHSLPATTEATRTTFFRLLATGAFDGLQGRALVAGEVTAPVVGGNLAMLCATAGTPFQLRAEGCILALEDVGEAPYRIDRMLEQLRQSGQLDGVAGIALGSWRGCRVPEGVDWSLDDIFLEHFAPLGVPVVADLPFGHGPDNIGLPLGRTVHLRGASDTSPDA